MLRSPFAVRASLFVVVLPLGTGFFGGLVQMDVLVYPRHPGRGDEVMSATGGWIILGELDAVTAFEMVNGADGGLRRSRGRGECS